MGNSVITIIKVTEQLLGGWDALLVPVFGGTLLQRHMETMGGASGLADCGCDSHL